MNRTIAMALAALVALASGFGLFSYVQNVDARAAADEELVTLLVSKGPIARSDLFDDAFREGTIGKEDVPARLVPDGAVTDPNALVGQLAASAIPVGQFVVADHFVEPAALEDAGKLDTFARRIPDGRVAITFQAGERAAVANLIQPGDFVNLLIEVANPADLGLTTIQGPAVVHVFQNLEILAIGQTESAIEGIDAPKNPGTGLYTVLVAPDDAARLVLLTSNYPVFLALVPPDNEAVNLPPVVAIDALPNGRTPDEAANR